jgi:tripeptide aminopeptidase
MYYGNWEREAKELSFPKLKNEIKIDWNLYFTLLYKQSPSDTKLQEQFIQWLIKHVHTKHPEVLIEDINGTVYITKGSTDLYPCVVAHTDTAQEYKPHMRIVKNEKWVFGFDMNTATQCGIGADDRNGILFCLNMLDKLDFVKVCFFRNEEIGCVASSAADPTFFKDCSMILQLDRNSYDNDLITFTNGIEVCSKEFVHAAADVLKKYDYSPGTGSCTDVGAIKKLDGVDCIACNISCGYYSEHMDDEVVSIHGFENAINFGYELIQTLSQVKWYHVPKVPKKVEYHYKGDKGDFKDDWDSPMYNKPWEIDTDPNFPENGVDYISTCTLSWAEIDGALMNGECPCCGSFDIMEDLDQLTYCQDCDSYFNIPEEYSKPKAKDKYRGQLILE